MAHIRWAANKERALFVVCTVFLLASGAAWLLSASTAAALWIAGTVLGLVFSVVSRFQRPLPSLDAQRRARCGREPPRVAVGGPEMSLSSNAIHRELPLLKEIEMYAAMKKAGTGAADLPGGAIASLAVGR
jgi:hypothetical protein